MRDDQTLSGLVGGQIFHRRPDDGATLPYVIFSKASGVPEWTFDGPPIDQDVWLIKGVGPRDQVEEIAKRLKQLLNGATLAIEGKAHQDLRHINDVDYDEIIKGERIDHVGAEFKLDSEDE
jgi:hypothetical protein